MRVLNGGQNNQLRKIIGLTLCVRPADCGIVVQISGDINLHSGSTLQDRDLLLEIMRTHSPPLLLDLSEVSDMDRSGPMALLVPLRRARLGSGAVELTAASDSVRRIITLADVQDVLSVPAVRPLPSQGQLEEYHGSADSSVLNKGLQAHQATERSGPSGRPSGPGPSYRYARGVPAGQPWRGIPGDGG